MSIYLYNNILDEMCAGTILSICVHGAVCVWNMEKERRHLGF